MPSRPPTKGWPILKPAAASRPMRCGHTSKDAGQRAVPGKRLEYAVRSRRDLEAIEKYHLEAAGDGVADRLIDAILSQAEKIAALGLVFRPGIRPGAGGG